MFSTYVSFFQLVLLLCILQYSQLVTLKAVTVMSIERCDFTVIFPIFPKIYRDFADFLLCFSYSPHNWRTFL